jgi:hypothetical protein
MTTQYSIVKLTSKDEGINTNKNRKEIETGLNFILSHLEKPTIFPRTIMTKKLGYQRKVYIKERALEHFIDSNFIDCRINAFPSLKEGATWIPDLLFIDLDLSNFHTKKSLQIAMDKTLRNIKEKLANNNVHPTVLWSGNGYHIILPVYCPVELERIPEFHEFDNPSERFLRFAKDNLSNNKADKANNPSFRSCLLRIPHSFNSKCLAKGESFENSKVKIVQEWNRDRPSIKSLLSDFRRYLINQKINDLNKKRKLERRLRLKSNSNIFWIEKLLNTPISDFRKNAINLILAPYLVNIKNLSYQESFNILIEWLKRCDSIRKLDFNPMPLAKSALNIATQKKIPPMKLETLRNRNLEIYQILQKL